MAFGIKKHELEDWKKAVRSGHISFITHFWYDPRFPHCNTVTKVGCSDIDKLINWGNQYGLKQEWIHVRESYPHYDLLGDRQRMILQAEGMLEQIERFVNRKK
ncbi:hypothetical protein IM538_11475 [Cytobacillus suaedae]|nr:hypothetical protein IM538_11475 [Cytobacillus suaedae]